MSGPSLIFQNSSFLRSRQAGEAPGHARQSGKAARQAAAKAWKAACREPGESGGGAMPAGNSAGSSGGGPPPNIWPSSPRFLPMAFIMSAICRCIFTSLLMSCTEVPEPDATRFLREALSSFGFLRSPRVIEPMIACWRFRMASSSLAVSSCFLILPTPGSMPSTPPMPPSFCICFSCSARSSRSKAPLRIFAAIFSALSISTVSIAFSTRPTTSPMPSMRPAMREGSKSSRRRSFRRYP